jgi:hypothetical protein
MPSWFVRPPWRLEVLDATGPKATTDEADAGGDAVVSLLCHACAGNASIGFS